MRTTSFTACCGLKIISDLYDFNPARLPNNMATVAVTNSGQEQSGTGRRLLAAGFERAGTFTGNYNNPLNLYLRQRIRRPPAERAPGFYSRNTGRRVTDWWASKNPSRVTKV